MRVRFWGTRGSIATPGEATVRYGGNTSCVEVASAAGTLVMIDCGTGARALGDLLMAGRRGPLKGHILISHTHWDHIQGLPFFGPLFVPGNEWDIYAPQGFEQSLQETLSGQMQYTYFPITLRDLGATIRYHEIVEGALSLGDIRVHAQYLNHPALTLGYRLEADGAAVVYACDHEPHSKPLAEGAGEVGGHDLRHAGFLDAADLVIHDAQYTGDEYEGKKGWGHSTGEYAAEVARVAGVRRLALTHHDPRRDDAAVDRIVRAIRKRVVESGSTMEVFGAAEGLVIELASAAAPPPPVPVDEPSAEAPLPSALLERTVLLGAASPQEATELLHAARGDGIRVMVATGDEETLAHAGTAHAALVLLDDHPPGLDARALCRALRAHPAENAHVVPVVVVTDREPATAAVAADDGIDWLARPVSSAYLRSRVRAALLRTPVQWTRAALPTDEDERIAMLHRLHILDTPREERFDRLTRLAAAIFDVPTALVSLVDRDRQWFKSGYGDGPRETPRDVSFCAHAVADRAPLVVPDALEDARFAENPMVTGGPRVRFYAGEPLIMPNGSCVGTVCLVDTRPRELDEEQRRLLADIGALVRRELMLTEAGLAAESEPD